MSVARDLEKFKQQVLKAMSEAKATKVMREMGAMQVEMVRTRTLEGQGSTPSGNPKPLKALTKAYIARRKALDKKGKLSSKTSPDTSNLTLSGQMLASVKVLSVKDGEVSVGPAGSRKKIFKSEKASTNDKISEYVSKVRPYLFLLKTEKQKLADFLEAVLKKATKKV